MSSVYIALVFEVIWASPGPLFLGQAGIPFVVCGAVTFGAVWQQRLTNESFVTAVGFVEMQGHTKQSKTNGHE